MTRAALLSALPRLALYAPPVGTATSATVAGVETPALAQDGAVVEPRFPPPEAAQDQVVSWHIAFK